MGERQQTDQVAVDKGRFLTTVERPQIFFKTVLMKNSKFYIQVTVHRDIFL